MSDDRQINGTLTYFNLSRNGSWYVLKGSWDDAENPDTQPIPKDAAKRLFDEGIVSEDGTWDDGNPRFTVHNKPVPMTIVKRFHGKGRRPDVTVHVPALTDDAPKGNGAPEPRAKRPTSPPRDHVADEMRRQEGRPAPAPHPADMETTPAVPVGPNAAGAVVSEMATALTLAARAWRQAFGDDIQPDHRALQATAATIHITLHRRGYYRG